MRVGVALGLILAATASSGASYKGAAPRIAVVVVDKLAFGYVPSGLTIGDSVLWVNRDLFRHSATAPGHFDVDLPPGARRRMFVTRPGVFPFTCKYHPGMKGILRVAR